MACSPGWLFGVLLLGALMGGTIPDKASGDDIEWREIGTYPFIAGPEREATIRRGYRRVAAGMTTAQVIAVLGEPDEIQPLYRPMMKNPSRTGFTYWFVLRRMDGHGSVNERDEALVRVSFDLQGRVTEVDAWGMD